MTAVVDAEGRLLQLAAQTDFYAPRLPAADLPPTRRLSLMDLATLDDLVAARIGTGSAYSGRRVAPQQVMVTLQLEYAGETRLYVGFDGKDLDAYAEPLERALRLVGLRRGATLAIHDYGSSPVVYLASGLYLPHAPLGAADRIGCPVICNDGSANLGTRAIEIIEYVRPQVFIVRSDCLEPFVTACVRRGIDVASYIESVVVTRNDGEIPSDRVSLAARTLGVRVFRLPRSDIAMFLAVECPDCGFLHVPRDLYRVEIVDQARARPLPAGERGRLAVTSLFALGTLSIRVLTALEGSLVRGGCAHAADDALVSLA